MKFCYLRHAAKLPLHSKMPRYTEDEIEQMFKNADFSKDGNLFHNELRAFLIKMGVNATAADVMEEFDEDGDGNLQLAEFRKAINRFFP